MDQTARRVAFETTPCGACSGARRPQGFLCAAKEGEDRAQFTRRSAHTTHFAQKSAQLSLTDKRATPAGVGDRATAEATSPPISCTNGCSAAGEADAIWSTPLATALATFSSAARSGTTRAGRRQSMRRIEPLHGARPASSGASGRPVQRVVPCRPSIASLLFEGHTLLLLRPQEGFTERIQID